MGFWEYRASINIALCVYTCNVQCKYIHNVIVQYTGPITHVGVYFICSDFESI